jgi:class 3 adenylate cyclase
LAERPEREQSSVAAGGERVIGRAAIKQRINHPLHPEPAPVYGLPDGDIIHTRLSPVAQADAAMLLLDIIQSTRMIQQMGDTIYTTEIMRLHRALSAHPLADEMRFLKCTGDGFLVAYGGVMAAVAMARSLRATLGAESQNFRLVVHWGRVKVGPGGDLLGVEVHRLFRVEAIQPQDRVQAEADCGSLPAHSRIVMTRAALNQLSATARLDFELVGRFRLKGFDEPEEVWAENRSRASAQLRRELRVQAKRRRRTAARGAARSGRLWLRPEREPDRPAPVDQQTANII